MAVYPLNLGALCQILQKALPNDVWKPFPEKTKHRPSNQRDIVTMILLLPYDDNALESLSEKDYDISDRDASNYIHNRRRVNKRIRAHASEMGLDLIQKNIETRILQDMSHHHQQLLLENVKSLVRELAQDEDHTGLRDYLGLAHSGREMYSSLYSRFMAKCVQFCLFMPNTKGERANWGWFNRAPTASRKGDPYRLVSNDPGSAAIRVWLQDMRGFQKTKEFHFFDQLTRQIQPKSLIIKNIACGAGGIKVTCDYFPISGYKLKQLKAADAEMVREFIRAHEKEFHAKRNWQGRLLSDMAYNGLRTGKWTAYGYFDPEGKIISYLDAKLRLDGGVELGIALTDNQYRGMQLASSLIYFFKLLFAHSRLFGGTYEENKFMRKTFDATGFTGIPYFDPQTGKMTSMIRERIDPDASEDETKDTNSVYYFSESLMTLAFRSAMEK